MKNLSKENVYKMFHLMMKEVLKRKPPVLKFRNEKDPFWILIKAFLSTRTKDEVTLKVVERLKKRIKSVDDLIKMREEELENLLYPVGFYKTKAKRLKEIAKIIKERGLPKSYDELISLPGVGRKVAKIYMIYALKKNEIAVDTHVLRITNRIFGKNFKRPEDVEKFLKSIFPEELWKDINWVFVGFGQSICKPKNPKCNECPIKGMCNENLEKNTL